MVKWPSGSPAEILYPTTDPRPESFSVADTLMTSCPICAASEMSVSYAGLVNCGLLSLASTTVILSCNVVLLSCGVPLSIAMT